MTSENLESVGLTKNESKTYLALIKLNSASATQIAKQAKIHRVNIYDILEKLQQKGLVASVTKSNKKYFQVANPKIIENLISQKEKQIQKTKKLLPSLIKEYNLTKSQQEIHSFKGVPGVKSVLKDILDSRPKEILNFGSTKSVEMFPKLQIEIWESRRIRSKIPMKIITSKKIKSQIKTKRLQQIKFLEKPFDNFTSTIIYGNKVASFIWTKEPMATIIQSEELAESYKNYFNFTWKAASKFT